MSYLFLHGLGQGPESWRDTLAYLELPEEVLCPDLFSLLTQRPGRWEDLYAAFCRYADQAGEPLHLCGLSLGAVLALQYAIERPQVVRSLVLIAPQYKMPRALLKLQSALFRLMPASAFQGMGLPKEDLLSLTGSMARLDLTRGLERVDCPALILCGERDRANQKASRQLGRALAQGKFSTLPGGHELNVDSPQLLGVQIDNFYRSLA